MLQVNDLSIPVNTVSGLNEKEYREIKALITMLDAISRLIYQGLYIIDFSKQNFLHVSGNPLFLCGHTSQEVKEMGYRFYFNHVTERELKMLKEIISAGFTIFNKIPDEEKINCTVSFDFHLVSGKKKILVNHRIAPILLTDDGKIRLAVCVVSFSSNHTSGNAVLRKNGNSAYWKYSLKSHMWEENKEIILNEREKDILHLSTQGYSMDEIAEKICISLDTVKFHKKNIFEKLQVKNIVKAIIFAANYKLL